jgi:acyl-CoA thioester hydrolase
VAFGPVHGRRKAALRQARVAVGYGGRLPCPVAASEKRTMSNAGGIVTYRGAVYPRDCDHMGHMNIATYGIKFDEANWVLFCEIGLTPSYLRGERHGMAGVQQNTSYRQELFAGDVLEIHSHVVEVAEKRLTYRHDMRNIETGSIVATCEITAVHLDKGARRACPFPDAVRRKAEALRATGAT